MKTSTSTITVKQFTEICDQVWTDRAALLKGNSNLDGEAVLVQAVFWRLCKVGIKTKGCADVNGFTTALPAYLSIVARMLKESSRPVFDSAPILNALIERYQNETGTPG